MAFAGIPATLPSLPGLHAKKANRLDQHSCKCKLTARLRTLKPKSLEPKSCKAAKLQSPVVVEIFVCAGSGEEVCLNEGKSEIPTLFEAGNDAFRACGLGFTSGQVRFWIVGFARSLEFKCR